MTRTTRKLALLAGAAAMLMAGPASAAERTLKLLAFNTVDSVIYLALKDFIAKVNDEGKGVLQIRLPVLGPAAIPTPQMGNAVKNGIVDIAVLPASYVQRLAPVITGLAAAEVPIKEQVKNGAYALLEGQLNKAGIHFLGQDGAGIHYRVFTNVPIKTLADFKGLRLRSTGTYKPLFDALGAQPVMLPLSDTFDAMQRGIVKGYGNVNNQIKLQGWVPITKYRVEPGFYDASLAYFMNLKTWNSLDAAQKGVLNKNMEWLWTVRGPKVFAADEAMGKELEKEGVQTVTLSPADAKAYLKLAHDALWAEVNKRDPQNGPKLEKLLSK
jgi:TRAP-type transport system periplasmic protein